MAAVMGAANEWLAQAAAEDPHNEPRGARLTSSQLKDDEPVLKAAADSLFGAAIAARYDYGRIQALLWGTPQQGQQQYAQLPVSREQAVNIFVSCCCPASMSGMVTLLVPRLWEDMPHNPLPTATAAPESAGILSLAVTHSRLLSLRGLLHISRVAATPEQQARLVAAAALAASSPDRGLRCFLAEARALLETGLSSVLVRVPHPINLNTVKEQMQQELEAHMRQLLLLADIVYFGWEVLAFG